VIESLACFSALRDNCNITNHFFPTQNSQGKSNILFDDRIIPGNIAQSILGAVKFLASFI
jgi:hypothetical protein